MCPPLGPNLGFEVDRIVAQVGYTTMTLVMLFAVGMFVVAVRRR